MANPGEVFDLSLPRRVEQLEVQIDNLVQESLHLLNDHLREVESSATNPTDFNERTKRILSSCNNLEKSRVALQMESEKE